MTFLEKRLRRSAEVDAVRYGTGVKIGEESGSDAGSDNENGTSVLYFIQSNFAAAQVSTPPPPLHWKLMGTRLPRRCWTVGTRSPEHLVSSGKTESFLRSRNILSFRKVPFPLFIRRGFLLHHFLLPFFLYFLVLLLYFYENQFSSISPLKNKTKNK